MERTYKFEVGPVVEQLDRILQMELAGVVYYTHYSFMVYGHARIPITSFCAGGEWAYRRDDQPTVQRSGMINPPFKGKGSHWTNETDGAAFEMPEAWLADAQKHHSSWWADWGKWLEARSGRKTTAMTVGSAAHPPIGDAPGTYVLEK